MPVWTKRCPRPWTGGQKRGGGRARSLCAADTLLLLDEPVAGLDPEGTAEMYDVIHALNQEGMTIVMVSHDMDGVRTHATHILRMAQQPQVFSKGEEGMEG